jgi:hypothetical protein
MDMAYNRSCSCGFSRSGPAYLAAKKTYYIKRSKYFYRFTLPHDFRDCHAGGGITGVSPVSPLKAETSGDGEFQS